MFFKKKNEKLTKHATICSLKNLKKIIVKQKKIKTATLAIQPKYG